MIETTAYYPSETRVMKLTLIRRERLLPGSGEILVQTGQRVDPSDVVARAEANEQYRVLDMARLLRTSPAKVPNYVRRKVDQVVKAGEVIAGRGTRRVRSPVAGTIVHIDAHDGRVAIEIAQEPVNVLAYIKGSVGNILGSRGVVVETAGALIQAVWGIGNEGFGDLRVVSESPGGALKPSAIDHRAHGNVVVAGGWPTADALEQAQHFQLRGLIVGGIEGNLIGIAKRLPFPIIVTEGSGRIAMSTPIFELLQSHEGREASFSAEVRTRGGVRRPEIVIPLLSDTRPSMPPSAPTPLTIGARVRAVRGLHMCKVGVVTEIPPRSYRIDTGTRVPGAQVRFDSGVTAFVPFANLEVLR
jgi:hypothetical protein